MPDTEQKEERHVFEAVTGFRLAIPPDRSDLLLFELKTLNAGIIRLSMKKDSAFHFGQEVSKAAVRGD